MAQRKTRAQLATAAWGTAVEAVAYLEREISLAAKDWESDTVASCHRLVRVLEAVEVHGRRIRRQLKKVGIPQA